MELLLKLLFLTNEFSDVLLGCLMLVMDVTLMGDCLGMSKDCALVGEFDGIETVDFKLMLGNGIRC